MCIVQIIVHRYIELSYMLILFLVPMGERIAFCCLVAGKNKVEEKRVTKCPSFLAQQLCAAKYGQLFLQTTSSHTCGRYVFIGYFEGYDAFSPVLRSNLRIYGRHHYNH